MKAFCAVRRLIPISVMCSEILSARIVCAWASVTVSPRSSRAARSSADRGGEPDGSRSHHCSREGESCVVEVSLDRPSSSEHGGRLKTPRDQSNSRGPVLGDCHINVNVR